MGPLNDWLILYNPSSKNGARAHRRAREIVQARGIHGAPVISWVALKDLHVGGLERSLGIGLGERREREAVLQVEV